jgi:hypothetical protein
MGKDHSLLKLNFIPNIKINRGMQHEINNVWNLDCQFILKLY